MRLSAEQVKSHCRRRGLRLGELLRQAGVSRTAYYSLVRKDSVLPKSVSALARTLGVPATRLLDESDSATREVRELLATLERIVRERPGIDRDNVRHTLLLLRLPPVDRLNRGLLRGRAAALHR